MRNVVVATLHSWNLKNYQLWKTPPGFLKHQITRREDLTFEYLAKLNPAFIFFPQWHWIIGKDIHEQFTCVIFHMTDVPFGRGGSPLQNLISRGIYRTKVSALRATDEMDAGPIYLKRQFDISEGSAQDIYERLSTVCFNMMTDILTTNPKPEPQVGEVVAFERRKPSQSLIAPGLTGRQLYDHIRMLDAEGYPRAHIYSGDTKIEFSSARLEGEAVAARAYFIKKENQT